MYEFDSILYKNYVPNLYLKVNSRIENDSNFIYLCSIPNDIIRF